MKTIDLTPLYRSSVGFDQLATLLDNAFRTDPASVSYPPYNIEMVSDSHYAITLAIAGFRKEDLEIQVERGVLTIRGEKSASEEQQHNYLYQGIATRSFERKFNLAEYVEVTGANIDHGLLRINLAREVPEAMKPRRIAIQSDNAALNHNPETVNSHEKAA